MINTSNTYYKDRLSKALVGLAVLFGIFSFTGYGSKSQANLERAVNTEIVAKKVYNSKRCISYKRLTTLYKINDVSKDYRSRIILAIELFQNSITTLKIQNASKHFLTFNHIFLRKIISSDNSYDIYHIS